MSNNGNNVKYRSHGYAILNAATADYSGPWFTVEDSNEIVLDMNVVSITGAIDAIVESHDRSAPGQPAVMRINTGGSKFVSGETITGGTSGATADVLRVDYENDYHGYTFILENITGRFVSGETITSGVKSGVVNNYLPASQIYNHIAIPITTAGLISETVTIEWAGQSRIRFYVPSGNSITADVDVTVRSTV